MTENEVILMFLCGIAIVQDSHQEFVSNGTWFDAINNCYLHGLEQQNVLQNKSYWLPKALYKTQWIEHLGCSFEITETLTFNNNWTIGQCQHQCIMSHASYFSYQNGTCSCLQQLPTILTNSTVLCKHIVYQTLNINPTGDGDCIKTKCPDSLGSKYTNNDLKAESCEQSYDILGICSDGSHHGNPPNNIEHHTALVNCINRNTHLPGSNDSSCIEISKLGTGWAANYFWSSIFRTSYSIEGIVDARNTLPISCVYGMVSENGTITEMHRNCNESLPYICKQIYTTTPIANTRKKHEEYKATSLDTTTTIANTPKVTEENKVTSLDTTTTIANTTKETEETNAILLGGVIGGISSSVLVLALLIAVVIIARKRKLLECKTVSKEKNTKVVSNTNSLNASSCQPDEEKNGTYIQHVPGLITDDEYPVITKTKITQRAASRSDDDGLLYAAPYGEYDRLHNSAAYKNKATHSQYDIANSNLLNGVYNVTVHHAGSKGTTDVYDHA